MVYRSFTWVVILHTLLIVVLAFTATLSYLKNLPIAYIPCIVLIVVDTFALISIFNQSNRNLAYFFESVKNDDTQIYFSQKQHGKSLQQLYTSMNRVNKLIADTKRQSRNKEMFYEALIQQSATGLIALNRQHRIELANVKACEMVGILSTANFFKVESKHPQLWQHLCSIKAGETAVVRVFNNHIYLHLLIKATGLTIDNNELKLISMHDIKYELESKETEAWQKLIRILTHEIVNSVAPITSLTSSLGRILKNEGNSINFENNENETITQIIEGLEVIEERGNGLMAFVSNYRKLTKIPTPVYRQFATEAWLNKLKILLYDKLDGHNITMHTAYSKQITTLHADEALLTQVLINLLNNATEALMEVPEPRNISVNIEVSQQRHIQISVSNNGPVISTDILDKIFVPFFTTRQNGSGIGLSLAKQIVELHKGYIYCESNDTQTKFVVVLPC